MNKRGGFTLVELVVVIVAVGILAGLAVIGITRFQADTRDGQRSANVSTISNALETYFTENGNYPSCEAITADAGKLTSTLKGLEKSDLLMPGSQPNETNAIRCGEKLAMVGDDFIEYQGDGSSSCNGSGSCSSYKLIYRNELSSTLKETESRGLVTGETIIDIPNPTEPTNPNADTLGTPTLSAIVNSPTQVSISWTPATNANASTTYTLLRATDTAFRTGLVTTAKITETNTVSTGLVAGRTYYFKVQAVSSTDTSDFSNVASNVIVPVTPTEVTAKADSAMQVTVAWAASSNATGYTVKYGLKEDALTFTATTKNNSIPISANITQGTEWFFKVYATVNAIESPASTSAKVVTPINAPAAYQLTSTNDVMSMSANASNAICPAGTTKYFAWKANDTSWVQGTNYARATYALSIGQGVTLTSAVRCQKGSIKSEYTPSSNSVNYTRAGMNLSLTAGEDDCKEEYCGRTINASWTNICGTTSANIKAKQLGALASWKASGTTSDSIKWKGAGSPGVRVSYYEVNIGCASAAASINVISAYKCTGCK